VVKTTPSPAEGQNRVVDDVVAVAVTLESGERRYFMTWGRIQDKVDPEPLEALILEHASRVDLGGTASSAEVCSSLAAAAAEPYFHEALLSFAWSPIPFGEGYQEWRMEREAAMREGRDIYYLGLST